MRNLLGLAIIAGLISAGSLQPDMLMKPLPISTIPPLPTLPIIEPEWPTSIIEPLPTLPVNDPEEPFPTLPPLPTLPIMGPEKPIAISKPSNERCWTEWFDMDDPSGTGDWELLTSLLKKYPGKICAKPVDIEARTLSGLTPAAAGDVVVMNTNIGFYCKNANQIDKKCDDYRVRFSCYAPYCAEEVCWTGWFDRDDPSGTGDWETLSSLRKQYPGKICEKPKYIEVRTVWGNIPATATGQDFIIFNPTEGFVCQNKKGQYCKDYKVRFGCCCD